MSDNLPETTRRHHQLKIEQSTNSVLEFCINALHIPYNHLYRAEKIPGLDSWYVYVQSGQRFMVTGPELAQWEARDRICSPGKSDFYD